MRPFLCAALAAVPACLSVAHADQIASALDHAPIGVMGDHRHARGEVMLSYRYMGMLMEGNRIGTDSVSPDTIVTTVANLDAPPPTLRVVPEEMSMSMHMLGAMYAPTDRVTLMVMVPYLTSDMDHVTYQGMMGTDRLGTFTTKSAGIGDVSASALIGLWDRQHLSVHAGIGVSLPTGSITEEDHVLTPMNTTPTLRLPYPMQLGSGTVDLKPSLTLTNKTHDARFGGGIQLSGIIRTGENDEGYTLGDQAALTAWGAWSPVPTVSFSLRGVVETKGEIDGRDPAIAAPVQTANPAFHGGTTAGVGLGANVYLLEGPLTGHRLGAEVLLPVYRDLNGPQLETDLTFTLGWQKAF